MPITITVHIWGITVAVKVSIPKSKETESGKKENRHSAK